MGSKERKEREKDQRRADILEAGEKVFLRKGLSAATMDEIARECELAKGTLYLYFPSKELLFMAIMLRAITLMYDLMSASQEGVTDPVARLAKIGEAQQRFYDENPDLFRIVARSSDHDFIPVSDPDKVADQLHMKHGEVWMLSSGIIVDGMKSGVFREDTDPMAISLGLHAVSMAMTIMMDQSERMDERSGGKISMGLPKEKMREMMNRNCGRIIWTILKNPEKYAEHFKR